MRTIRRILVAALSCLAPGKFTKELETSAAIWYSKDHSYSADEMVHAHFAGETSRMDSRSWQAFDRRSDATITDFLDRQIFSLATYWVIYSPMTFISQSAMLALAKLGLYPEWKQVASSITPFRHSVCASPKWTPCSGAAAWLSSWESQLCDTHCEPRSLLSDPSSLLQRRNPCRCDVQHGKGRSSFTERLSGNKTWMGSNLLVARFSSNSIFWSIGSPGSVW
jgi:hypothetical protein